MIHPKPPTHIVDYFERDRRRKARRDALSLVFGAALVVGVLALHYASTRGWL